MLDFSKIILLQRFINRANSQRGLKIVQGKLKIFQRLTPTSPTFDGYACGIRAFTNNEVASCIDVLTK